MRERRFIGELPLQAGEHKITDTEIVHQVRDVLRLSPGAFITLSDGRGSEARAVIRAVTREHVLVEIGEVMRSAAENAPFVTLYACILKRENFELVVQKATELGVSEIVPLISERTVKLNLRHDRLERIAREAAEQSGRSTVPCIREEMSFSDACAEIPGRFKSVWMCDGEGSVPALDAHAEGPLAVLIGPEGGWAPEEKQKASEKGYEPVLLSPLTLRGETAAIVASFLAVSRMKKDIGI